MTSMRTTTNYPNRKHTPETMRDELTAAQRSGKPQEISDLSLLILNAERPTGAPPLPGVDKARNRQGMRRYARAKPAGVPLRRSQVLVGDWVEDPTHARWRVTRIHKDTAWYEIPGAPSINCHVSQLTIVNGPIPAPTEAPALEVRPDARAEACEALYQGVWDAYEVQDWTALERALRAYETRLAALGV